MDVPRKMHRARQKTRIVLAARFEPGGDIGSIWCKPYFFARANRDASGFVRQPHRSFELMERQKQPVLMGVNDDKMPRLVSGDQERDP